MCGIFGISLPALSGATVRDLGRLVQSLFRLSESRGKEAAGLAFQSPESIRYLKVPVRASRFLASGEFVKALEEALGTEAFGGEIRTPVVVLGHTRLVTHGAQTDQENNHPVVKDGVVCVHNGIVVNHDDIWSGHPAISRTLEVDTEVIPSLVRMFLSQGNSLGRATGRTFDLLQGTASVALVFEDKDGLVLATNNGSLYYRPILAPRGFVFASERRILKRLSDNGGWRLDSADSRLAHLEPGRGCLIGPGELGVREFALHDGSDVDTPTASRPRRISSIEIDVTKLRRSAAASFPAPGRAESRAPLAGRAPRLSFVERGPYLLPRSGRTGRTPADLQRCARCILPETMPFIRFDDDGICKYCRHYRPYAPRGREALERFADGIRSPSGETDCIVAYSGGRDSSYMLHFVKKELALHPVAYTYDWGMVNDLARRNQARMCGKLGVEHIVISADIDTKRAHIRRNVDAWLRRPDLGVIPLFMAGDKQFFYFGMKLKEEMAARVVFFGMNELENDDLKVGFCGISAEKRGERFFDLTLPQKAHILLYYGREFLRNPAYLNSSIFDTAFAYWSYYLMSHDYYVNFYSYVPWSEDTIVTTLRSEYDWELARDTSTSWRIGDGTAAFYNYIYYTVAGVSEIDAFRSNQVREGILTRDEALGMALRENRPRFESVRDYCQLIGIDADRALATIDALPRRY